MAGMTHPMSAGMPAVHLSVATIALAVLVHTLSLLFVAGALAVFFYETYEKLGLSLLKHTWLNFDRLWAIALILAGFIALLM